MGKSAITLRQDAADALDRADAVFAQARAQNRPLSASEQADVDKNIASANSLRSEAELIELKEYGRRPMGRLTDSAPPDARNALGGPSPAGFGAPQASASRSPIVGLPQGFTHWGNFFQAVRDSSRIGGTLDRRLEAVYNGPAVSSNEGSGPEGGYTVAPEWAPDIMQLIAGEDSLIGQMNVMPVTGNTYVQPTDQRAPWDSTGGVRAFWTPEGAQLQQSNIDLKVVTKRLQKLTALVPVTEELLEDAPSLDAYLRDKVGTIFDFQTKLALIQGSGAGMPLGIMNSPALLTVPKVTGQAASTIVFQNVLDMWSQLLPGSEGRSFWLATKRAQEQLMKMFIPIPNQAGTDNVGGLQVYIPMGSGISGKPYDRLMGRPVLYTEACSALGSPGDLILCDGKSYGVILKTIGLVTQISLSLWFDYAVAAYRFHVRLDGSPLLSAPVPSRDGTTTYSPFVCLAQRS